MSNGFELSLELNIAAEGWREVFSQPERAATRAAQAAFQAGEIIHSRDVEASIRLTDDAEIQALNKEYRKKNQPTNVLSFPALDANDLARLPDGAPLILGDIVVALETTLKEAEVETKVPEEHLSHLVVHGMLHLLGYDHETESEAKIMEGLEIHILKGLGIRDPYTAAESLMGLK